VVQGPVVEDFNVIEDIGLGQHPFLYMRFLIRFFSEPNQPESNPRLRMLELVGRMEVTAAALAVADKESIRP